MLQIDWSDPDTFWLNLTNIGLGLVTLACCGAVAYAIGREFLVRLLHRAGKLAHEPELDDHTFRVPELGLTMADGGKREDEDGKGL